MQLCSKEHDHKIMKDKLTNRQQEVYDFLKEKFREIGVIPSSRDIQDHFGFASQTAAMNHLRSLEKKGVIKRNEDKRHQVAFTDELDREEIVDIPVYGAIAAGLGEDQEQQQDGCISIDIRSLGIPRNARTFALKVRGDSMIDAHICDGDTVILEFREPRRGDVVAALIDGETTLKRYVMQGSKPYLQAENEMFPDLIPARELIIQGVMVALLRNAA